MTEQMYTTDTAAERLARSVAEAVESAGRFSRAEFSVDDVATILEATVQQPNRDDLIELLNSSQHAPMETHDGRSGECVQCPWPLHELGPEEIADAVLAALAVPATGEVARPEVVVLCGSTRFYDEFQEANYDLTMQGKIVLSVGFYPHSKAKHGHGEGVGHDSTEKVALDELHKRKIDIADSVYVLNVGGYIGESTRGEIDYAESLRKPIAYMVEVTP